jgi:hypothetical protein
MLSRIPFALLAAGFACSLFAAPAQAQRDRVFVASYGSDSNPCTFGSPCKTFQNAVNVVGTGGEVTAIDSAGFGPISITKSVTITSPTGVEAGIAAAAGADAIDINAPGGTVRLHGLTLEGANSASAGINFYAGSVLEVIDCIISDFNSENNSAGIYLAPRTPMTFLISNTKLLDNADDGIYFQYVGDSSSGIVNGVIDHVVASGNGDGIVLLADAVVEPVFVTISNSDISNNSGEAIDFDCRVTSPFVLNIDSSVFNNNEDGGVYVYAPDTSALVLLGRSVISGNGYVYANDGATGLDIGAGTVATYGDNRINGNANNDISGSLDTADDKVR